MMTNCKDCVCWIPMPDVPGSGRCQRHPPQAFRVAPPKGSAINAISWLAEYPMPKPDDGCFDGIPKE